MDLGFYQEGQTREEVRPESRRAGWDSFEGRGFQSIQGWLLPTEHVSVSAHFGLHWVRPGTISVNVTWMKRGFNACQTHRSMYPSIFNRFPVIQPVSSKVRHFSTSFAHLASHGYALGQSR